MLICLPLENLTSTVRTGLLVLVELIDLVNPNDLTQMVNCSTLVPDCDSHSLALLDLFLSSEATMTFPPLRNSDHVAVSDSIVFPSNSQRDAPFHRIA